MAALMNVGFRTCEGITLADSFIVEELLGKISLTRRDHLIFTGDMINKGPQSCKVVDLARQLGASCVRGNHEDRILLIRSDLLSRGILDSEFVNEYDLPTYDRNDRQLARSLTDGQAAWLQECPVILKVGQVKDMGEVIVVHGGLHPAVPLDEQELTSVMSMRKTFYGAIPWFRVIISSLPQIVDNSDSDNLPRFITSSICSSHKVQWCLHLHTLI